MTIFRLKQLASSSAHAVAGAVRWNYDRAELIADGVVHGIGVFCGVIAATVLVVLTAVYATGFEVAVVSVYVAGLLTMLVFSATYNLWPISRAKWVLRRFDHSAIYVLIAATYTPFITQMKDSVFAIALLTGVWCVAIVGIVIKLLLPGRFDRLAVGIYLAMGWSGFMVYDTVVACSIVSASSFMHGSGSVFKMQSGIPSYCWARPATTPPCSISSFGPEPFQEADLNNAGDRQGRGCHWRRQRHWPGALRSLSSRRCGQGGRRRSGSDRRRSRRGLDRRRCIRMRCRPGERHPPRHRGNRAAIRPDRAVLLQCRHRRRFRSVVGKRRRHFRRAVGAKLGDPRHGACLCRAAFDPTHEGAPRRVFPQHDFRRRPVVAGGKSGVFDDQACGGRVCGEPCDLAQGRWHQGFDPVSEGRRYQHAAVDP